MGDKSKIEWTDTTWNPIRGCSKVSSGCANCYAESMASRFSGPGQPYEGLIADGRWNGVVRLVPERMDDPLRWKRPRRIFVNSMSDLFHESLDFETIAAIFGVMAASPQHTFQVLTKRASRMQAFFQWVKAKGDEPNSVDGTRTSERMIVLMAKFDRVNPQERFGPWPLPNVWIGVSVENQEAAILRGSILFQIPAAVRWFSCEPLLGPVDLSGKILADLCGGSGPPPVLEDLQARRLGWLDWVVVGGESGSKARPMHIEWVRDLRDQCFKAKVPFLFKQHGEWAPAMGGLYWHPLDGGPQFPVWASGGRNTHDFGDGYGALRLGKARAGRLLDGRIHDDYPDSSAGSTSWMSG